MRKPVLVLLMFLVTGTFLFAQNEVVMNVGDTLSSMVASVPDGGTLLIKQGLHKDQHHTVIIDKSITIKGEQGDTQPKVYFEQFDVVANNVSITLENLDLSGASVDSLTGVEDLTNLASDYLLNIISGDANTLGDITIKNCTVRNLNKAAIRGDRDNYTANKIVIDNCIMNDFRGGSDYGPFRLKSKIVFSEFDVTNSTFYNIENKFIDCQDMVSTPAKFLISNCTFYNWGGGKSAQYLFDIKTNDQAQVTIQNCILGKTNVDNSVDPPITVNGFRFVPEAYKTMTNSVMTTDFIVTDSTYAEVAWNKVQYNEEGFDVTFADPENGDFTLPDDSPLLHMSPDGTVIGDPRWDPNKTSIISKTNITLQVYPNPAQDKIYINLVKPDVVTIYSIIGQPVREQKLESGQSAIQINDITPGVYFIQSSHSKQTAKLIVK